MTEKGIMHDVVTFLKNSPEETRQQIWEAFKNGVEKTLDNVIEKEKAAVTGLEELNNKYRGKFLFFNGDENGCQWLYVKEFKNIEGNFYFQGTMIEWDCQDNYIQVYECEQMSITRLMYFEYNWNDGEEPHTCEELDEALMSRPIDTSMPSHLMTADEVARDIIKTFQGMCMNIAGYSGMDELYDALEYILMTSNENEVQDC